MTTYQPCPRCHTPIPSTSAICPVCGLPLMAAQETSRVAVIVVGGIVALLAALAVTWVWGIFQTPARPSVPRAAEAFPPMVSGERDQQSASFTLSGGDYVVDWTASDTGLRTVGCSHFAHLEEDDGSGREDIVSAGPDGGQTERGTARLHDIRAGRWYFYVISGCAWTLAIRR